MVSITQRAIQMTEHDLAQRYRWFCLIGYRKPVLNDPRVIRGDATPEDIDALIQEGMQRWPIRAMTASPPPSPSPKEAA